MKTILVTGSAGFIGKSLSQALMDIGHTVHNLDCFLNDSYSSEIKRRNWDSLKRNSNANSKFFEMDLRHDDLELPLENVDTVINLAAMPGLMKSWSDFSLYVSCNLLAVERLLNSIRDQNIEFIQASTSSVYGINAVGSEDIDTKPLSPYGVSKLAAEHLIQSYHHFFGINYKILRFFSVYGPGQRPDMGYQKFCEAVIDQKPIILHGDGKHTRSATYITDCVESIVKLTLLNRSNFVVNISGNEEISTRAAIEILSEAIGKPAIISAGAARPGDQISTKGDTTFLKELIGAIPQTSAKVGLTNQALWNQTVRGQYIIEKK